MNIIFKCLCDWVNPVIPLLYRILLTIILIQRASAAHVRGNRRLTVSSSHTKSPPGSLLCSQSIPVNNVPLNLIHALF